MRGNLFALVCALRLHLCHLGVFLMFLAVVKSRQDIVAHQLDSVLVFRECLEEVQRSPPFVALLFLVQSWQHGSCCLHRCHAPM